MIDTLMPLIKQFLPYAQKTMGFKHPPRLFLRSDAKNASNPLGKTAFYDPGAKSVTLYVTNRHPKDIMRSLSHELVHHTQNCQGEFENTEEMGEGYAQNDVHLRNMERQAYEMGNLCFRDWEDSIKHTIYFEHLQKGVKKVMSTKKWKNREISSLLAEAWGFNFNLDEKKKVIEVEEGFDRPKSATGAGPTNKAGNTARSDVGNQDKNKFGQGGSAKGGKKSASGTNTPPPAGNMGRTGDPNTATGRWLKEEEGPVEEDCPPESDVSPGEVVVMGSAEEEMPGEGDPEDRAVELVDELRALIMQLVGEEDEEEMVDMEERAKRDYPRNTVGRASARRIKSLEETGLSEAQLRSIVERTLKRVNIKNNSKGN